MLKRCKLLAAPTLVVAHQLSGLSKSVAIETSSQGIVRVAAYGLRCPSPRHEYAHGGIGTVRVVLNLPAQGVLIGHGCTTGGIHVVLARTAAHNGFRRIRLHRRLGIFCILQNIVCCGDTFVAGSQLRLNAVEVGLCVQSARMDESAVLCHSWRNG